MDAFFILFIILLNNKIVCVLSLDPHTDSREFSEGDGSCCGQSETGASKPGQLCLNTTLQQQTCVFSSAHHRDPRTHLTFTPVESVDLFYLKLGRHREHFESVLF